MFNLTKVAAVLAALVLLAGCDKAEKMAIDKDLLTLAKSNDTYVCSADPSWIVDPSYPTEVKYGKNAQICQFYQFSWQTFINLMSTPSGAERKYQSQANYPVFLGDEVSSCANQSIASQLFLRTQKDVHTTSADFVLPTGENQALGDAVLYDQNGNIVLYEARFDRNMCQVAKNSPTLPPLTTEIKSSWRKITDSDKPDYIWIQSDTNGNGAMDSDEIYGLVGFHLVKSTELHPEFIWATFEHRKNAPDCQKVSPAAANKDWSFTSETCANSLPNPSDGCDFNKTLDHEDTPAHVGTPTEVCQVYAQGTRDGDNQSEKNRSDIITINAELNIMFNLLPSSSSLAVLKNYELVGALWENDVNQPSSDISNLRGSIQLANTTMETNAQQGFGTDSNGIPYTGPTQDAAANCFSCHGYSGPTKNAGVSHMFKHIHGATQE
ncbi:hypothetical protein NBRC116188_19800 [Oceaniserpentilla sp. 4NH20-0058]|uniref:hypothetical protein n=1 Tax=Oceaniserpentilla sp. 4NH20-0058 TaxID=3127660 RepID=UPI0031072BB8